MQKSFQDMAHRIVLAENSFRESVMRHDFTVDEADTIARVYVHIGQLQFDAVDGQFYIRHGALMESATMRNAVINSEKLLALRKKTWKRR